LNSIDDGNAWMISGSTSLDDQWQHEKVPLAGPTTAPRTMPRRTTTPIASMPTHAETDSDRRQQTPDDERHDGRETR
jgi:hypothetical protein